jgi:hypothetical protein
MRILDTARAAAILATACTLVACGPSREEPDAGVDSGICVGPNCLPTGTDGGAGDGGVVTTDGGYDGGLLVVTLQDLRGTAIPFGANVQVQDVVVHTVSYSKAGTSNPPDYRADFWVSDPANPPYGIWVSKHYNDTPGPYLPAPGDKVTITGYFGTISRYSHETGYRRQIAAKSGTTGFLQMNISAPVQVAVPSEVNVVPGVFGNADGGTARPDPEYAGSRVFIQGPVEISDPRPKAMHRISANPDDPVYYGFELQGGILVNNSKTFSLTGDCPWQAIAVDAGTQGQKVVFAGGVKGVWDSYTHAPCEDGGTNPFTCGRNLDGQIPGTQNTYTFAVYPQSCADFVGGEVVPQ